MSADTVIKRILKMAMALGTTWGTCPSFGAGDQIVPQSDGGLNPSAPLTPDKGAGMAQILNSVQGSMELVQPSFTLWPYETCDKWLQALACIMGDDTVTGVADPYTHTMEFQDEANDFVGVGFQEGDEVKRVDSLKFDELVIEPNDQGIIEFKFKGKGNAINTGTATDLDSVTKTSILKPYVFKNATFRINAQSDSGLASPTDDLTIAHFKITITRPSESVIQSGGGEYSEPKQGDFPQIKLEIKIDQKNTMAKTLHTAWENETLQKADIVITGSTDRSFTFEFPALKVEKSSFERKNVIGADFVFLAQKALSGPTGMTGVNNTVIVETDVTTSPLV